MFQSEDRSPVLRQFVQTTIETLVGFQKLNEQQLNQTLGALVRTKALSADDSYTLRDQLLRTDYFDKALDSRIEAVLRKRGLLDNALLNRLHIEESANPSQNTKSPYGTEN